MSSTLKIIVNKKGLRAFIERHSKTLVQINKETASVVEQEQVRLCPKSKEDHVHLYETIEKRGDDDYITIHEGNDAENDYAAHVEFGTKNMAAKPHARPAAVQGAKYRNARVRGLAIRA